MKAWQGIMVTMAIIIAALVVYDKWVKGRV